MISDTTLTNLSNGLGVSAMLLIVVYHFIAVNGKRMEAQGGKTIGDLVSAIYLLASLHEANGGSWYQNYEEEVKITGR
jgi:hypothetical protein